MLTPTEVDYFDGNFFLWEKIPSVGVHRIGVKVGTTHPVIKMRKLYVLNFERSKGVAARM